jgi:hypothetical protein
MASESIETVVRMMELLPETAQSQVADHLREYLLAMQDELHWDELFKRTQPGLAGMARRAREEIAAGKARPFDYDQL